MIELVRVSMEICGGVRPSSARTSFSRAAPALVAAGDLTVLLADAQKRAQGLVDAGNGDLLAAKGLAGRPDTGITHRDHPELGIENPVHDLAAQLRLLGPGLGFLLALKRGGAAFGSIGLSRALGRQRRLALGLGLGFLRLDGPVLGDFLLPLGFLAIQFLGEISDPRDIRYRALDQHDVIGIIDDDLTPQVQPLGGRAQSVGGDVLQSDQLLAALYRHRLEQGHGVGLGVVAEIQTILGDQFSERRA